MISRETTTNMSSISRHSGCVSSKSYCEEKIACDGDYTEAEFSCVECGTLQCEACEGRLHELSKYLFHDRRRLQLPPQNELCQLSCTERNYADVKCEDCRLQFCNECFQKMHSNGKRSQHTVVSVNFGQQRMNQQNLSQMSLCDESATQDKPGNTAVSVCNEQYLSVRSSMSDHDSLRSLPDIAADAGIIPSSPIRNSITSDSEAKQLEEDIDEEIYKNCKSFLLADQAEILQVRH